MKCAIIVRMKLCECGCGEPAPISKVTDRTHGYLRGEPRRFINGHQKRGTTHSPEARARMSAVRTGKPSGRGNPGAPCCFCEVPAVAKGMCRGHYDKVRRTGVLGGVLPRSQTRLERYMAYVDKRGPDECWPWTGGRDQKNYGHFANNPERRSVAAHRYGFGELVRPLKPGEVVDHICHNTDESCPGGNNCEHRACQNPAHWEAVSEEVNVERGKSFSAINARKTHCDRGHEFTPDNIYWMGPKKNRRACKTCVKAAARRRRADKPARAGQL